MDFDSLDLREAAEKEYWVHLRMGRTHLYADMEKRERPCRLLVASIGNVDVEHAIKAVERAARHTARCQADVSAAANREQRLTAEAKADDSEKLMHKALTQFLTVAVIGWENIEKGGKALEFSASALKDMAQPKAPLFRLAENIAQDMNEVQSPFYRAETD